MKTFFLAILAASRDNLLFAKSSKMVFSKNPMPSQRFCVYWLFSVIVSGLFIYPILTFGFLNLGGKLPGLDGVKKVYEVKNKIAKRFHDQPVLYVTGGSSAYYGIDAALMERRLGRPIINYGVHAGLGLDYQLFQLKKILKPDDSVLLAFEQYLLADLAIRKTDFLHAYVSTYDKSYLIRDGWIKLWKDMYNTPLYDWKLSVTRWGQIIEGKTDYCGNLIIPNLLIGERGDFLYKHNNVRPLNYQKFYKLGKHVESVLSRFVTYCTENKIQLYFTWATSARHPGYFGGKADEYKNSFLSFFEKNNIVVLDECDDHLYPESFYSNTYNHLNAAGRRIRTEKLIRSFQHLRVPPKKIEARKDLFLVDIANHETVFFDFIKETDFDFRVYSTEEMPDADSINDKGIEKSLNKGLSIYFNDPDLKHLGVFEKVEVMSVETDYRTLLDSFDRYPNHIFFLVQNGPDLSWDKDVYNGVGPLADFFVEEGYRAAVIGTGAFSDVKKTVIQKRPIQLLLEKESAIGSFRLPFNVRLESGAVPASARNQGGVKIGDADFIIPRNGPGIWCVVYDPNLGVVSDRFFYEHPGENIESELYCAKSALR